MWQGILTSTHISSGLVIIEEKRAGEPTPDQDAAWRQAQELLEAAQKEAPDLVHSIYVWDASGGLDNDRPGVDLEFTDSPEEIKLVFA
jgi:hypothetical protein